MAVLQGSEEVHILRNPIVQQSIWIPTLVFKEGTKTTSTDVSPAGSKNQKQVEMEGRRDFMQECAVEDEEWKWSPVYLLLKDFSGISAYVPCPRKHTAEEWHLIQKFIQAKFSHSRRSSIVVASQYTWKVHFSEKYQMWI
jgi:hypothetical protein